MCTKRVSAEGVGTFCSICGEVVVSPPKKMADDTDPKPAAEASAVGGAADTVGEGLLTQDSSVLDPHPYAFDEDDFEEDA